MSTWEVPAELLKARWFHVSQSPWSHGSFSKSPNHGNYGNKPQVSCYNESLIWRCFICKVLLCSERMRPLGLLNKMAASLVQTPWWENLWHVRLLIKDEDSGAWTPGFEFRVWVTMWPWQSHSSSLGLSFLICNGTDFWGCLDSEVCEVHSVQHVIYAM